MAQSVTLEQKLQFLIESSKILALTANMEERITQKARLTVPLLADWCTVNVVKEDGKLERVTIVHRDPEKVALVDELAVRSERESTSSAMQRIVQTGRAEFYPEITDEFLVKSSRSPERLALARKLGVVSTMIIPIVSSGKVLGVLSVAYAESGRHYTEEDFVFMQEYCNHLSVVLENARLYEELKAKDAAKDEFLATLSHELRNPLAPIKTMLELIKLKPQSAELKNDITVIEHQFDHLTKILIDLLEVNRYARGKINLELRRVNLLTAIKNSIESAAPFIKKKGIAFTSELPSQTIVIRADQTRLEQALMNVLHNAEKFTPPGGRIWIELKSDDHIATITIGDTGVGIDAEMLPHLFEPAARSKGGHHKTEGLGLGLMLVKEIVQLHGGTITAQSEGEGKGTQFSITLPVLQQRLF
jgi:signal transduction histidine kinase